jgi:hypothetical protein
MLRFEATNSLELYANFPHRPHIFTIQGNKCVARSVKVEIKFGSIQTQPKQKVAQAQKPTSTCTILHQNQIPFKGNKEAVYM